MGLESNRAAAISFLDMLGRSFGALIDTSPFTEDCTIWTTVTGEISVEAYIAMARNFNDRQVFDVDEWVREPAACGFTVHRTIAEGDTVALEASLIAPLSNGESYKNSYVWLVSFRDGKISRIKAWNDTAQGQRLLQQDGAQDPS